MSTQAHNAIGQDTLKSVNNLAINNDYTIDLCTSFFEELKFYIHTMEASIANRVKRR